MQTPTKKTWARLSFDEVCDRLRALPGTERFQCVAKPYGGRACTNFVEDIQISNAIAVLRCCGDGPAVKVVRDIIHCVICDEHDQNLTQLKNIERAWQDRFEDGFFDVYRSPSPYSQDRKRKTSLMARSPRTPRSCSGRRTPTSNASEERIPRIHLTPDSSHLGQHQRSFSEPQHTTTSTTAGYEETARPASRFNGEPMVLDDESPTAERRRYFHGPRPSSDLEESTNAVLEQPESPSSEPSAPAARPARGGRRKRQLGQSVHEDGFYRGNAHYWAPWTIRSKVVELLQEKVPSPDTKARLYAVRVNTGTNTRYVKIGYTSRGIEQRLGEIGKQHSVELDVGSVFRTVEMPIMQAMRLEALVHADLAFFQRDLCVVRDNRSTYHVEYFETSLSEAQDTITMWQSIMEGSGMQPGKELSDNIMQCVRRCSTVFEIPDSDDKAVELQQWLRINADHHLRKSIWRDFPRKGEATADYRWRQGRAAAVKFVQIFPALVLSICALEYLPPRWLFAGIVAATWSLIQVCRTELVGWLKGNLKNLNVGHFGARSTTAG